MPIKFWPLDLGEGGELVGRQINPEPPISTAAVWRNNKVESLIPSATLQGSAMDINNSGQVVGYADFASEPVNVLADGCPDNDTLRCYLAYVLPDHRLHSEAHLALANNNIGQVVGCKVVNYRSCRAVIWDTKVPGDPVHELAALPGEISTIPSDINDAGVVVGTSDSREGRKAVAWKDGAIIDITRGLPESADCFAYRINSSNDVVGQCYGASGLRAFLWHDDNNNGRSDAIEVRDLQPYFPESESYGPTFGILGSKNLDINDSGQIVYGKFIHHDDDNDDLPDAGETKNLNSLLIDTSYGIEAAMAINNRGQILVRGWKRGGNVLYFLLDPLPEPVIFVPGILGSTLRDRRDGATVWFSRNSVHIRNLSLFLDDHPSRTIEATDVIRRIEVSVPLLGNLTSIDVYAPFLEHLTNKGKFREYKVSETPSKRTTAGCDLSQRREDPQENPNLFILAYDWRHSNVENATKLKDFVGCVRGFHPDKNINIVAHSMGGLLSRRYILDNPGNHHIQKLITVATPWLGAPQLLHTLETGSLLPFLNPEDVKYIMPSIPSAHELLPSRAYQQLGGKPILSVKSQKNNENKATEVPYDYEGVLKFLDQRHCPKVDCGRMPGTVGPGTTGDKFHSYSTPQGQQDNWHTDSTGVSYFHFYAVQRDRASTITEVIATETTVNGSEARLVSFKNVRESRGDGTVPTLSASRCIPQDPWVHDCPDPNSAKNASKNFNALNAKVIAMVSNARSQDERFDHKNLINLLTLREAILRILKNEPVSLSSTPSRKSRKGDLAHHAQADDSDLSYYIYHFGGSNLKVTDTQGNSTAQIEGELRRLLPEVGILSLGTEVQRIRLPVSPQKYSISFTTDGRAFAVRILKGEGIDEPTNVILYQDIVLPAGVSTKLVASANGIENLRYDSNGDGTYDASVSPTLVLSGSAALDTTAPTLTFVANKESPTATRITITAADDATGVLDVHYSTDGSHFQKYTTAAVEDPTRTPSIYAFATDKAGNRSAIISYSLGSSARVTSPGEPPVTSPVDTDGDSQPDSVDADDDNDGQSDADEQRCGSDPLKQSNKALDTDSDHRPDCADTDDDGDNRPDETDNCPQVKNADQADKDGDGKGDVCGPKARPWLGRLIRWLLSPFR